MSESSLNPSQARALRLALNGENLWILGPPGTGKTFLNEFIRQKITEQGKVIRMAALTGTAASLLENGMTIHSFTGTGADSLKMHLSCFPKCAESVSTSVKDFISSTDTLVIDECSMMGESARHHLDLFLRKVTGKQKFNGGIQVIMVGDICQLPPIDATLGPGERRSKRVEQECVFKFPDEGRWRICVLSDFVRQAEDPLLQQINLSSIDKRANIRKKAIRILNKKCCNRTDFSDDKKLIEFAFKQGAQILTPTNARVEELIKTEEKILKKSGIIPQEISRWKRIHDPCLLTNWQLNFLGGPSGLKKEEEFLLDRHDFEQDNFLFYPGQITRITRNGADHNGTHFMNGDACKFLKYVPESELIHLTRMRDGATIYLHRIEHVTEWFKEIGNVGYEAFPLVRAIARTVHSNQGQTLDKIIVDPFKLKCWNKEIPQMINVMFSRVRRISDIYLTMPIQEAWVEGDEIDAELAALWALDFMNEYPKVNESILDAHA